MNTGNNEKHIQRSHPVHLAPIEKPNLAIIIFVTACSKDRKKIFARSSVHRLVIDAWMDNREWIVGRYVLMPDHIHLFCAPYGLSQIALRTWVRKWKSFISRNWPCPDEQPIWQVDLWDRQLRQSDSYQAKWDYVRYNPVRQGLCRDPDEWPYQGHINQLEWHD